MYPNWLVEKILKLKEAMLNYDSKSFFSGLMNSEIKSRENKERRNEVNGFNNVEPNKLLKNNIKLLLAQSIEAEKLKKG